MRIPLFTRVQTLAADILELPPAQITEDSSPHTIENWDSVQNVNIVLALEEMFGVEFEVEEIERMKNIGAIVQIVKTKVDGAG